MRNETPFKPKKIFKDRPSFWLANKGGQHTGLIHDHILYPDGRAEFFAFGEWQESVFSHLDWSFEDKLDYFVRTSDNDFGGWL